jgi:hypothetical protein
VRATIFFQPPALSQETVWEAGEGEGVGNEVLFHAGMMPTAFADYVQSMRIFSGYCRLSLPS